MLHKDYDCKCSAEKNYGGESQGACRQDKPIGGKPPVVFDSNPAESQPMKRRLGGWCEIASSLGVSRLTGSSVWEAVNIEPERVKLKNFHC
jgi:hypothetical protein